MNSTINFGIDLGTTNSLIAKFGQEGVQVYKNPLSFKDTLPSVVWIRKNAIIVGEKAFERLEKDDCLDVFSRFKRKMGTIETYQVHSLNGTITPQELSSYVLKELKLFVQSNTENNLDSAVITVPASFDAAQSKATLDAGKMAGFNQVVLLQEPIAASLAFANLKRDGELPNGKWLVYDLGGGTFDLALVGILDGELKIIDHEGDNYLGGGDFDSLIVQKIIVPYMLSNYKMEGLEKLKDNSSKFNTLYHVLIHKAEIAKIELSARTFTEIEIDFLDNENNKQNFCLQITRAQFEELIQPLIDKTIEMVKVLFARNKLMNSDVQFLLMVGGSTFVPLVKERVEAITGVKLNCDIDPVTAIAVGAAFYAGTKKKEIQVFSTKTEDTKLTVRFGFNNVSKETMEPIAISLDGDINNLFYRITSEKGDFDSGLKSLQKRVLEEVRLVKNAENIFIFNVYDKEGNLVITNAEPIRILQGIYSISGQPLPEDVSLETDNYGNNNTGLRLIWKKGTILPLEKSITVQASKTLKKGDKDFIKINVYYGPCEASPAANILGGTIIIDGDKIDRDIIKGSDIELKISKDESQTLTISVFVTITGQTFEEAFELKKREVNPDNIREDLDLLNEEITSEQNEINEAQGTENVSVNDLKKKVIELQNKAEKLSYDDGSDAKYQLDDEKRTLYQKWTELSNPRKCAQLHKKYQEAKVELQNNISKNGNEQDKIILKDILAKEDSVMLSINPEKIQLAIDEIVAVEANILWRTPAWLAGLFEWLLNNKKLLTNENQANSLFAEGAVALKNNDIDKLKYVNEKLIELMPGEQREELQKGKNVGIIL